ncbi:MAG: PTS sugar transporter subunit IIA [Candidatus Omnitrophota bacterium]|nr:PTS sugar transporter subunit IIA [Candidatus Omnitrophota bacterium]MBU1894826.1 PTS sugar transporter subunit IIA [Candidatus Omnitrophota bacterium]
MNIVDLLSKDAIAVNLESQEKSKVLSELVDLLVGSGDIKKVVKNEILKRLQEREMLGSTGIGKNVAIPHAKCPKIKKMIAAFGISKNGLDFKSLDGEPTHIFFLLIAPGETPGPHLKALAKISRLLDDKFIRDRLLAVKNSQDVLKIIKEEERKKTQ